MGVSELCQAWLLLSQVFLLRAISSSRLIEISQIWWRLVLFGRHQQALSAQVICFPANEDKTVGLGATILFPIRPGIWIATVAFVDSPGAR